ncbi:diacylglycerol/lipid kinase family protein [Methylacidiphilum caldifontis]|uniref:Diacylglycerol kinase n=1 Tax=Methylacidiphilum caldifontis TaxID=2795386 RepID=A0A4Y8P6L0_9BACT|nr:diacylglycerol kinase family protein [Methylacidiphilum caldifontis]QSR89325.1 diacylglycerol kinase family lipid kinase [Methylacidiphilum caldifontis]TFE65694.1 diacylglycerol kinase [Methylacidiphilum caldifontis]
MQNKICIIFNPAARGEKAKHLLSKLYTLVGDVPIKVSQYPGDAEAKTEWAIEQGYDLIVAAGGDGTINEVVNGFNGREVILGVIPLGTINVFAMELGLPRSIEKAWATILQGNIRAIDFPKANDQHFVQLAGVGLDAKVLQLTHWNVRKTLGPLSYLFTVAYLLKETQPSLQITLEEGSRLSGSFLLIGNGRYYGGPFAVFPKARLDDGLLDGYLFSRVSSTVLIKYWLRSFMGGLYDEEESEGEVIRFQSRSFVVQSKEEVPVELDGDFYGHTPVSFSCEPQKLKVIVP